MPFETRICEPDFLEFAAINEKFRRNSLVGTDSYQVASFPIDRQSCCNVPGPFSQFKGNKPSKFSFEKAVSQFIGNSQANETIEEAFIIPTGNTTRANFAGNGISNQLHCPRQLTVTNNTN